MNEYVYIYICMYVCMYGHIYESFMRYIFFQLIESYFRKLSQSFSKNIYDKYTYFLKRISDTKNFNLDEESLLEEFNEEILNG